MRTTVRAADGVRLDAEVLGPDDAPVTVVLAHGWAQGRATWDAVARDLVDDGLRVVRFDQRGHGDSERGDPSVLTLTLLGDDLAAVIEELTGAAPVVLAGHSMGGMATMALARRRPDLIGERVQAVALVSTSAGGLREVGLLLPRPLRPVAARAIAPVMAHVHGRTRDKTRGVLIRIADLLTRRSTFGRAADRTAVAAARQLIAATHPEVILGCSRAMAEHDEVSSLVALRAVPVAVLVGSRDVLTPTDHARLIAEESHGRLVVCPDAGHMLPVEAADVVLDTLLELVREVAPVPAA